MTEATKSGLLRALAILNLVASRTPQSVRVSDVARELDLPKAVAHRMLKDFTAAAYLSFDEDTKQYRLGSSALKVGLAALRDLDVPRVARPHLERLVEQTGETATLSVRTGWSRVYVDQVLSPNEVRMSVTLGTTHPLYAGSSSKAILAHLDPDDVEEYLDTVELEQLTSSTVSTVEDLRADLERIRERGYAISAGERQAGAGSVAAPVYRGAGEVFGSLSLCGPSARFTIDVAQDYGRLVLETADLVNAELGHGA